MLSTRKREIMELIEAGKSRAQIAVELRLGIWTIKDHLKELRMSGLTENVLMGKNLRTVLSKKGRKVLSFEGVTHAKP